MEAKQKPFDQSPGENSYPVSAVLCRASEEMSDLAKSCTEIQWLISTLLETADHPDLARELHMLQDIDRMQQTLTDLAASMETLVDPVKGRRVKMTDLYNSMQLESVKIKLLGPLYSDVSYHPTIDNDDSEITWL